MSDGLQFDILKYSTVEIEYLITDFPAWLGHIIFAYILIAELKPKTLVELGAQYGNSYFAMCQSISGNKLDTKSFAVDTWTGDNHTGSYSDEVYLHVMSVNQRYIDFSTLLRLRFDDALVKFDNDSIDILHIDGYHTYEAVKHDFETWLPKVKPGGIILFHDVNEFQETFGAHRVWNEIKFLSDETYLFRHSHGLGVWRKPGGKKIDSVIIRTLLSNGSVDSQYIDNFMSAIAMKNTSLAKLKKMNIQSSEKDSEIFSLNSQLSALVSDIATVKLELNERNTKLSINNNELQQKIDAIYSTKGYRLLELARRTILKILPIGSLRRKFVKIFIFKPLKLTYKAARYLYHNGVFKFAKRCFTYPLEKLFKTRSIAYTKYTKIFDKYEPADVRKIDIIVPVYNAYEFLESLFSDIITNTDLDYQLIVVNDKSSDARVRPLLEQFRAKLESQMLLIDNDENVGFLKSVNRALALSSHDVVIVNTNVRLPKNWASRLFYPIFKYKKIASVTPFSNAGALFSLPQILSDNILEDATSFDLIDSVLQKLNPNIGYELNFPTGVGFCMAMNKSVIDKIGYFDEIFGKGYAEETDWCMRAADHGYRNVLASDLFVYHKHGGSFTSEENLCLLDRNRLILISRYPNYDRDLNASLTENYYQLRDIVLMLYYSSFTCNKMLIFDHSLGGGASIYSQEKIAELKAENVIYYFQYFPHDRYYKVTIMYKSASHAINFSNTNLFFSTFERISFNKIVVNSLVAYEDTLKMLDKIKTIKNHSNAEVIFLGHDFHSICPSFTLMSSNDVFCNIPEGEGSTAICEKCFKHLKLGNNDYEHKVLLSGAETFKRWRDSFEEFYTNTVDKLIVFSHDSKRLFLKAYPNLSDKIDIVPHDVAPLRKINIKSHSSVNIAFLGDMTALHKGRDLILEMHDIIKNKGYSDVNLIVIGSFIANTGIKHIGRYKRENLPEIMEKNNVDIIFISSICPETFSYTTNEAMMMGLPVASFNIGAPAERIAKYDKGLIISEISAKKALEEIYTFAKNKFK